MLFCADSYTLVQTAVIMEKMQFDRIIDLLERINDKLETISGNMPSEPAHDLDNIYSQMKSMLVAIENVERAVRDSAP